MPLPRRWRHRLLGSLQGQLQLATYLVVFLGFTAASVAGLWVGQRNLIDNEVRTLRRSADSIQSGLNSGLRSDDAIRKELLMHSSVRTTLWLEQTDGSLLLPDGDNLDLSEAVIEAAMAANPRRVVGSQTLQNLRQMRYLSELVEQFPSGARLWILHEVGSDQRALSNYLGWMTVIWGGCLVMTLLAVSWLVERIVKPLDQLNAATSQVTAETLSSAHLSLQGGPKEVMQLGLAYNGLLDRLAMSWSQQRQFVSAVSHELQAPLTLVSGSLKRVIRKAPELEAQLVQRLQDAEDETVGMQQLLNDLLDLSRSDSGRLQVKQEPVDLRPLLEEVVRAQGAALDRELPLELPSEGHSTTALGDAARLRQVLLNLIENAHKYSPPEQPIQLRLRSGSNGLVLEVEDRGIGIPLPDQAYVFDRFHRGANTTGQSGSGVGLSVVKLLLEAMGGSIDVRSEPGMGSCFRIQLRRTP